MSKTKVTFKAITVQQAEQEDTSSIYALNRIREQANINLNITLASGEKTLVTIPSSPCPMDLSVYAPKRDLLASPTFRRMIAAGHVTIVDSAEAFKFITEDPRGIRETRRIFKDTTQSDMDSLTNSVETEFNERASDGGSAEEQLIAGASIFVEGILARAQDPNEDVEDLISELESRINTLSEKDLSYIADNCVSAPIKEWAISSL